MQYVVLSVVQKTLVGPGVETQTFYLALGRLGQEDVMFGASLGYRERPYLIKTKQKEIHLLGIDVYCKHLYTSWTAQKDFLRTPKF